MKKEKQNPSKELYRQMRALTCDELWENEVARFDRASPREREERVAVVRAVGVVFSEKGTEAQREKAKPWLRELLQDPCEKIRRYAMAAMPKLGAGAGEEKELLGLLRTTGVDREKKFLGRALEKIAGTATLAEMERGGFDLQTRQKVQANVARSQSPSAIRMAGVLSDLAGLRIHLRGRGGLEEIVSEEVSAMGRRKFRVEEVSSGLVAVTPIAPFTLGDLYALRCFGTVGFVIGQVGNLGDSDLIEAWASLIASPLSRNIFKTFTEGSIRYRLDFVSKGHQRGAVRLVANRAFALCADILNDAKSAPWTVAIHPAKTGSFVELSPRLIPDPRLTFRQGDVPAASHPPLAACMARLAGKMADEVAWDPFCGSGSELIERALLGGVRSIHGTDLSAEAIAVSQNNFAAANLKSVHASFTRCDFRDVHRSAGLGPNSASLVITNPPMGRRVPIPDLRGLMVDLFASAATVLKPGGRLVFANPVQMESPQRSLKLQSRRTVDFGGFKCWLEKYAKTVTSGPALVLLHLAAALFFAFGAAAAPVAAVTVGDPKNPDDLPHSIYRAHDLGAHDITLQPGIYDMPTGSKGTILLENWSDTAIHAAGVTLIFEELVRRPLCLRHCKNVTWDGGTLRLARPAFTQGRIKTISTDEKGGYCDWQIDAGYSTEVDPAMATFNVIDPSTRLLKAGSGDWRPQVDEKTGPGLFRIHFPVGRDHGAAAGDWLVARAPAGTTLIQVNECENCTIENATLENAGFGAFFETGGVGGNHYLKCKIDRGPRPAGATEDELVSCGADGFHSTYTRTGPDIEDCIFTGVFLDDCIAIHGSFHHIVSATGATLVLQSKPSDRPVAGDTLRIADMQGFFAQAKCTAVKELPSHDVEVTLDQKLNLTVNPALDINPHKGAKANDPERCGRGYKILRCRLGNTRSRGILAKADDGLIDHCQIEGCGMSGVSIGPEFWWGEAEYSWNVTVSNNTFVSCSQNNGDSGSLWIHGDGAIGNRNITITQNTLKKCYGQYVMKIEYVDGVQITHNKIDGAFPLAPKIPGNIIWLSEARHVKLLGNAVTGQGSHAGALVALSPDMNPREVENNNPAGVALPPLPFFNRP